MDQHLSPHLYALATVLVALLCYLVFVYWRVDAEYFFIPIFALALVYAALNLWRQSRGGGTFALVLTADWRALLRRALVRYLFWFALLFLGWRFYSLAPYYSAPMFANNTAFFDKLIVLYAVLGLPYFLVTLIVKASRREDFYDPAVRMIHIARQITRRALRGERVPSVLRVFRKPYNRKIFLTLIMRAYFIPVMVSQVYGNMAAAINMGESFAHTHTFVVLILWLSALIWLCDTINASVAYCLESRWIENRTRSVDLTLSGWSVCLFCYPPLNTATSSVFPFAPVVVNNDPMSLVYASVILFYFVKILQVSLLALHVYIDLSLGPSVANISFKKLQTRGLYGVVRHPGTVTKLTFWLLISGFYRGFWNLKLILGQLAWSTIYVLRALTEERHLGKHEVYRRYREKVRYRFIPGLI